MENPLIKIILCINSIVILVMMVVMFYAIFNFNQISSSIEQRVINTQQEMINEMNDVLNERTFSRYPIEKL